VLYLLEEALNISTTAEIPPVDMPPTKNATFFSAAAEREYRASLRLAVLHEELLGIL
jgi:hypothetical protein